MPGWMNHKLESRLPGIISTTADMQMIQLQWQKSKEELKKLLMGVKEDTKTVGLKLIIHKTKIMASGPINEWQKDEEKVETETEFVFLGSKITDFSHEIQTLAPWKKAYDKISILKSIDITLLTKVCRVKATVFPVVTYGCESWTIRRLSTEELMLSNCAEETLESPLGSKKIKPVTPKGDQS